MLLPPPLPEAIPPLDFVPADLLLLLEGLLLLLPLEGLLLLLLLLLPGLLLLNFLPVPALLEGAALALLCTVALKANGPCRCPNADAAVPVLRAKPEEAPLGLGGP